MVIIWVVLSSFKNTMIFLDKIFKIMEMEEVGIQIISFQQLKNNIILKNVF